jgi:hypothetical protein
MSNRNLSRRLERIEAELTPSIDNEEVITMTVRFLGSPGEEETIEVMELHPIEPNRRRRWPRNWSQ